MVEYKRSVCPHDCPDTCGMLVGVENDRVTSVKGDPDHPFTRGALCVKVNRYPERVHSPLRVLEPLKRTGPKGTGSFRPIGWDEALEEIVNRYRDIMAQYGAEAILPYSYAGTMGVVHNAGGHAFFHKLGASRLLRTICSAAVEAGHKASLGATPCTDVESAVDSDFILIWGSNTLSTNVHAWPFFLEARKKGADIWVIDPYRNQTAQNADRHLRIKPGTDAALALAVMKILIDENLVDRPYIDRWTTGFEALAERAAEYPADRVAETTGLSAAEITDLARRYGRADKPFIRLGWGPARQLYGGMAARTICLLPALVGALGKTGAGLARATSPAFGLDKTPLERPDLAPAGVRTINMVELGRALTQIDDPPVKAIHVYQSNPAVIAPDSSQVIAGFKRDDLFVVVNEQMMTETALMADIILPAAMSVETTDLYRSYGHYYLQMAHPAVPPAGQSRSTLAIFQALAEKFGFQEEVFHLTEAELIQRILPADDPYFAGITFQKLTQGRPLRLNVGFNPYQNGFNTPSGKVECHSDELARAGLDPLPHGRPSVDVDGQGRYPLQMITPPRREFLNSTFNEVAELQQKAGNPTIMIHPDDAADRNLEDGETVRVYNDRGECYLFADVTDAVSPGVTVVEGLYWPRFMPLARGVNQLTSQRLTDMGQTCALHCNLVEVESAV